MKLEIIKHPNPILNQKSKKITIISESIKKLAKDMEETIESYGNEKETGVALAAIQVGVPVRLTVLKNEMGYQAIVNPKIIKHSEELIEEPEGCMSVPQKYGPVKRFKKIKVRGLDLDGKKIEIKADGFLARVLQHEIDHMDGKLFLNMVEEKNLYTLSKEGDLISERK